MPVVSVECVFAEIAARPAINGIRIVGVDGPSGSGKSTVAALLSAASGAPVIQCDDFVSWQNIAGWWTRFEQEVLDPLVHGADARYQVRDWQGDEFGASLKGFRTVAWTPLVIVEGITCTRAAAGPRVAYRIWVDAPYHVRLQRGVQRDGETHRELWVKWMEAEGCFFDQDRTRDLANLLVDGASTVPIDADRELAVEAP